MIVYCSFTVPLFMYDHDNSKRSGRLGPSFPVVHGPVCVRLDRMYVHLCSVIPFTAFKLVSYSYWIFILQLQLRDVS